MNYLIDDIGLSGNIRAEFEKFAAILDGSLMTKEIERWDGWKRFNTSKALLIFPGNGSQIVRKYLDQSWLSAWQRASVHAKRVWIPGESPCAFSGRIYPEGFLLGLCDVVIIDDVVSSGSTIRKIRDVNFPWIPGAKWHAVSWIRQRAANARGFESFWATVEAGERNKKAPINSLSTFIEKPEIAENYARRNFRNAESFLSIMKKVK